MKVVVANNYYYLRGGCERVMFNDIKAMSAHGVDIVPFAAADPDNDPTPYSNYFVPGADIRATDLMGRAEAAVDAIHCGRTAQAFAQDAGRDEARCSALPQRVWTACRLRFWRWPRSATFPWC